MFRDVMFADLEKLLLKLGFITMPTTGTQKVFQYPPSAALVILPGYENKAHVHPIHVVAVRRILIENGLIDSSAFDSLLKKVPSEEAPV
jgi:predicted RNA binding protein YcfA (HicA-like mRNA interferase family)